MQGFLDHFFHPASIVQTVMGPVTTVSYQREPRTGGSVSTMTFASGAVATLHLAAATHVGAVGAIGRSSARVRLSWSRTASTCGTTGPAPGAARVGTGGRRATSGRTSRVRWSGSRSSQLANSTTRISFCWATCRKCCTSASACWTTDHPSSLNLDDTLAMMRWYECYRQPAGQVITIPEHLR